MTRTAVASGLARRPLAGTEVHVWTAALDTAGVDGLDLLAPDERQRAARFAFDADRRRFIAAHGALRTVLAAYMGRAANALKFKANGNGKPALASAARLRFSLSHAGERAAIAVTLDDDIGIDIEAVRPIDDARTLAELIATERERDDLGPLPQPEAFLRLWTRKEAALKALGSGLGEAPRALHAGIESARRTLRCPRTGTSLVVASLAPFEDHAGQLICAVARCGGLGAIHRFELGLPVSAPCNP